MNNSRTMIASWVVLLCQIILIISKVFLGMQVSWWWIWAPTLLIALGIPTIISIPVALGVILTVGLTTLSYLIAMSCFSAGLLAGWACGLFGIEIDFS